MKQLPILLGLLLASGAASAQGRFHFTVLSTLDETCTRGIFRLDMRSETPADVSYELLDQDGLPVADAIFRFRGEMVSFTDTIPGIRKWSAETPELYTLLLRVNGEQARCRIGFRRLERTAVPDGGHEARTLLVNGQPVRFKGVDLPGAGPDTREGLLEELQRMKLANINAIHTRVAPPPRLFYELCDSLGFYVFEQAGLDSLRQAEPLNLFRPTTDYTSVTLLPLADGYAGREWNALLQDSFSGEWTGRGSCALKHDFQDISIIGVAPEEGRFSIRNHFYFKDLSGYKVRWRLERDGKAVKKGKLSFTTPARGAEEFTLKLPRRKMRKKGEYRILFETETTRALPLLAKGAIVATDEILIKDTGIRKAFQAGKGTVEAAENETEIRLTARQAELVFDKASGQVTRYGCRGADVFAPDPGLRPDIRREPADTTLPFLATASLEGGTVHASYALPDGGVLEADYTLLPSGQLHVSALFRDTGRKPLGSPRFGFRFRVKDGGFQYFGRGPEDDACGGSCGPFKSVFTAKGPEDSGRHTETEWLATRQLTVVADSLFTSKVLRDVPEQDGMDIVIDGEAAAPDDSGNYSLGFTLVPAQTMKTRKAIRYAF